MKDQRTKVKRHGDVVKPVEVIVNYKPEFQVFSQLRLN